MDSRPRKSVSLNKPKGNGQISGPIAGKYYKALEEVCKAIREIAPDANERVS